MSVPHFLCCSLLFGLVIFSVYPAANVQAEPSDHWQKYGWFTIFLMGPPWLILLALPQSMFNFLGLVFFQSFPDPPKLKVTRVYTINIIGSMLIFYRTLTKFFFWSYPIPYSFWSIQYDSHTTSRICFRVVTRGDYPELVRNNCYRNINTCQDVGLRNFYVEVVTDKSISIAENESVREVVVPSNYTTRSGAMFKARALQYALEDEVNICLC